MILYVFQKCLWKIIATISATHAKWTQKGEIMQTKMNSRYILRVPHLGEQYYFQLFRYSTML